MQNILYTGKMGNVIEDYYGYIIVIKAHRSVIQQLFNIQAVSRTVTVHCLETARSIADSGITEEKITHTRMVRSFI